MPRPPRPRPKSGRKRGAQKGHPGATRKLAPVEQVKAVHDVKPDACRDCGHALTGEDPAPYRHQVTEIPPVVAEVTEYRLHTLPCPECGTETRAELPRGVPQGARGGQVAKEMLGETFSGIVGSDRWSAYNWLLTHLRQLCWAHLYVEGVEPTNNLAERKIRPNVLWRNGSFGTQSQAGSRFAERIMTVVATLKQQHRNVLDYLTEACDAANSGRPALSLLPGVAVMAG